MNGSNLTNISNNCTYEKPDFIEVKFWLIAVFGSSVCAVGIGFNAALMQVLLAKSQRTTYLIYLAVLAIMDIGILITYVLLMVTEVLYDYYENFTLYRIWLAYLPYFYTLSRMATLASAYLVVACTFERYLEVVQIRKSRLYLRVSITQKTRYLVAAMVVLCSFAFRFVVAFELRVDVNENCAYGTFEHLQLTKKDFFIQNYFYREIYSFWLVHIVQVFFPFFALVALNVLITASWKKVLTKNNQRRKSVEMKKFIMRSRSARKMMAAIVTTYLICHVLHIIITFWEHIDMDYLKKEQPAFYSLASDVVTLLTAINASLRLPIYYASNSTIRAAIRNLLVSKGIILMVNKATTVRRISKGYRAAERRTEQANALMTTTNEDT